MSANTTSGLDFSEVNQVQPTHFIIDDDSIMSAHTPASHPHTPEPATLVLSSVLSTHVPIGHTEATLGATQFTNQEFVNLLSNPNLNIES